MANVYWHADGGNWSDYTNHWFNATDGGGGSHGAAPGADDNAIFDANSFDNPAQTVTVDATAYCLDMDWTGATNTPTLAGSSTINCYGSFTLIVAMVKSFTGELIFKSTSVGKTITSGSALVCPLSFYGSGGGWTLQDSLNIGNSAIVLWYGTLDTNNQNVTCGSLYSSYATTRTMTLGTSVITCTVWNCATSTNLTISANTATINVTGTGAFAGGGITTYNHVNLNGTAHTISGNNTIEKLRLAAGSTITVTPASTQTIRALRSPSTAANVTTINTGGAAATIKGHRGYCELNHVNLTAIVASEKYRYYAGNNSTDGTGNTNWIFTHKARGVE